MLGRALFYIAPGPQDTDHDFEFRPSGPSLILLPPALTNLSLHTVSNTLVFQSCPPKSWCTFLVAGWDKSEDINKVVCDQSSCSQKTYKAENKSFERETQFQNIFNYHQLDEGQVNIALI